MVAVPEAALRSEIEALKPRVPNDGTEKVEMSQQWISCELHEHEEAIKRHQRYVAGHETIIQVLRAFEQQTITRAQAIAQLEEAVASQEELGLGPCTVRPSNASLSAEEAGDAPGRARSFDCQVPGFDCSP